ncbi:MAG: U32 family peptidase [Deltaproteobacteria bacterium]|nr:U32 family peptidase [Deltaproteobacteria bacterium]
MQILTPVAGPEEVEPLVSSGADELYAGIFPDSWYERFGRGAWPNRRGPGPANLRTVDQVVSLQRAAHATEDGPRAGGRSVPLYLAVNAPFYTDEQAAHLLDVLAEVHAAAPVDAFIVTDPGFMALLRERVPEAAIFASTVTVALNSEAVRFLAEDLECSRVILSRHLDLREIRTIRDTVPDVDLEVFLLNDNCYFEEGFCSTTHTMPGFGVYCMTPWEIEVRRDHDGAPISGPEERARWDFLIDEHREFIRHLGNRGHGAGPTKMPLGPCGLCGIPELMDLGIHSGKIVGREASLFRKLRSVQAVRYVRDSYGEGGGREAATEAKRRAIELRGDPAGCAAGYSCYYRPARQRDLVPLPTRPRGPRRPRRR